MEAMHAAAAFVAQARRDACVPLCCYTSHVCAASTSPNRGLRLSAQLFSDAGKALAHSEGSICQAKNAENEQQETSFAQESVLPMQTGSMRKPVCVLWIPRARCCEPVFAAGTLRNNTSSPPAGEASTECKDAVRGWCH